MSWKKNVLCNNILKFLLLFFMIFNFVIIIIILNTITNNIENLNYDNNKKLDSIIFEQKRIDSTLNSFLFQKRLVEEISDIEIPNISEKHFSLMLKRSKELKIPIRILFRLIKIESNFNPNAVSKVGAYGYMQLMPGTFYQYYNHLNLQGGHTPENNIIIGTYYLKMRYKQLDDWSLALSAYNAGIANIYSNFNETIKYVKYITKS